MVQSRVPSPGFVLSPTLDHWAINAGFMHAIERQNPLCACTHSPTETVDNALGYHHISLIRHTGVTHDLF